MRITRRSRARTLGGRIAAHAATTGALACGEASKSSLPSAHAAHPRLKKKFKPYITLRLASSVPPSPAVQAETAPIPPALLLRYSWPHTAFSRGFAVGRGRERGRGGAVVCRGRPVASAHEVHVGPRCLCLGLRAATPPQADTRGTASVVGTLALALRAAGRRRLTHGCHMF